MEISYDQEEDILSLISEKKVKHSIDVGDFIVDIDHKGFVSGIEILNATDNLDLSEKQLEKIEKGSITVSYKPNYVRISLILKLLRKQKDITIPLTLDLGHNSTIREEIAQA